MLGFLAFGFCASSIENFAFCRAYSHAFWRRHRRASHVVNCCTLGSSSTAVRQWPSAPAAGLHCQLQPCSVHAGKFQQYDYSSARLNSLRYGQATPPTYQLENVRLNLMLFYGNRDALSSRRDVQHLVRELRNSRVKLYQVRGYNHIDFLYATTAPQMIYERIIQQARQINWL